MTEVLPDIFTKNKNCGHELYTTFYCIAYNYVEDTKGSKL